MFDFLAQVSLSATRRALAYCIAILSLGMGVAAFVCLGALSESFTDTLRHRVSDSGFTLEAGPSISIEVGRTERQLDAEWINEHVSQAVARDVGAMTTGTYDVKVGRHALRQWTVGAV